MIGPRISPVPYPKAPIADIFDPSEINEFSAIYSHFRLVKGYTGFCRRVRRASDSATLDVGFTAGGLYNLKAELLWAAGSSTTVTRIYNQNTASVVLGAYLESDTGIVASTSGAGVMLAGYPAMSLGSGVSAFSAESYSSEEIAAASMIASVSAGTKLFSISAEGDGFSANVGTRSFDSGPFEWSEYDGGVRPYFRSAAIPSASTPFLLGATYDTGAFIADSAHINGVTVSPAPFIDSEEGPTEPVGMYFGQAFIGGGGGTVVCHTFVLDSGLTLHNKLRDAGNARNWIY